MISLNEIENSYNEYSKEIFSYILRSVYDHDLAEDILQDVFIKLLHYSAKKDVHGDNIRALLYTIARSVTIDAVRKAARIKSEACDISILPDSHAGQAEQSSEPLIEAVSDIIDSLGEPEKSIILFRQNGLTYQEISAVMKIPERTLKRKTRSAIENIRKKLQAQGFFIPGDTTGSYESFKD